MPQGPAHLHERFGDDATAWKVLHDAGWQMKQGLFWKPNNIQPIPQDEYDAADYLVCEWDWSWEHSEPAGENER